MDTCGGRHLRFSFLKDMGPTPKLVQRTRLPRVEAIESRYDFFNRISGKVVRSKLPKNCGSAIASDDATMTFVYGHVNGVTRELTWRPSHSMPRSGTSLMAHKSPTRSCSWSSWISPRPAVSLTEDTCDVLSDPGVEPARLSRRMMDVRQSRRRFCLQTRRTRALLNMSGARRFSPVWARSLGA